MSTRALIVLITAGCIGLAGCGGGEQSGEEESWSIVDIWGNDESEDRERPPDITIATPSITGFYVTSAEYVHIAGTASDWDADIAWDNDAGGAGHTSPQYEVCWDCRYDWSADVRLAMGENKVTIVIQSDVGAGEASITITREAAWSWRR